MKKEKRFVAENVDGLSGYTIIVDTQTGVNYLLTAGTGMTPLYNADGSLIVTPKKTEE